MPQPNLFWTIGQLLTNKKVDLPDNWNYYMVNRYYSMSPDKRIAKVAYYMDMHIYSLREDPQYLALLYKMMLPKLEKAPFIKYIYGVKESDESKKFKFILERIQDYYGWTKEELNKNMGHRSDIPCLYLNKIHKLLNHIFVNIILSSTM